MTDSTCTKPGGSDLDVFPFGYGTSLPGQGFQGGIDQPASSTAANFAGLIAGLVRTKPGMIDYLTCGTTDTMLGGAVPPRLDRRGDLFCSVTTLPSSDKPLTDGLDGPLGDQLNLAEEKITESE